MVQGQVVSDKEMVPWSHTVPCQHTDMNKRGFREGMLTSPVESWVLGSTAGLKRSVSPRTSNDKKTVISARNAQAEKVMAKLDANKGF